MTPSDEILLDQLDQYIKGTLSHNERVVLEEKMKTDKSFKLKADEHIRFILALQQYGNRETLKTTLNTFHDDIINGTNQKDLLNSNLASRIQKYWPAIAVAASVVMMSITGTLIVTRSLERKQKADYKELRRNVEQIKKSQKAIMADIREVKEKDDYFPVNYEGTGFLISSDGYVATSCHVVRDADSVYLENKKFGRLKATIVKADLRNDIAILKIKKAFHTPLPYTIRTGEVDIGEDVFTLGFPREDIVYGEGTISAATGYRNDVHAYQITVPVNPGNSGGPLLNRQGQLVGIISGVQTETSGTAFAIKSSVLLKVIGYGVTDSLALPVHVPKRNMIKNMSRVDQIKKVQDFIFVVKVFNNK